jgi:uncharacterized repeat protein (TIGR01451 family)
LVDFLQLFKQNPPNRGLGRVLNALRVAIVPGGVLVALGFAPVAAAADVTFGSPLHDAASVIPYRNGWDQTVFNTAGPAAIGAPAPGLIKQVRLRGMAADGKPLRISFRVVRPVGAGRWKAISTPMTATLPAADGVHAYKVPDPRAFRVAAGDYVAVSQQGFGGAGRRWRIFAANDQWTLQKVATDKNVPGIETGFNDGELSPSHPVDAIGNSTLPYPHTELLLQAVESPDRCPGTDLPQLPCRSKLYIGGHAVKNSGVLQYTWTVRNGGPHLARGISVTVDLPAGTTVEGVPPGCGAAPGPPVQVTCTVGDLPAPQNGNAVARISFVAVPHRRSRHFRAVAEINAPGVVDPHGASHHVKVVSTSTRGM